MVDKKEIIKLFLVITFILFVLFPNSLFDGKINVTILLLSVLMLNVISISYSFNKVFELRVWFFVLLILGFKFVYYIDLDGVRVSELVRFLCCTSLFFLFKKWDLVGGNTLYNKIPIFLVFFQIAIVLGQVFFPNTISNLYDISKIGEVTSNYTQFRYTGSLFNPNTLGVFFVFCFALIIKWEKRFSIYFILFSLIFISGSRTSFLMAVCSVLVYEMSHSFNWRHLAKGVVIWCVVLTSLGVIIFQNFSNDFYYFSQIAKVVNDIINGEGISSFYQVSSLMKRISVWSDLWSDWWHGGLFVWLLGLPDINNYRYADNSYVYLVTKYGIVLTCFILYYLFVIFGEMINKYKNTENFSRLCFWICFCLLSGLFSDILVSYYFWIMMITFPLMVRHEKIKHNTCDL